ncbi:MAG: polysaccharide pyruvyl transferase family protein [Candidatus Zophobacter franzmannii]|nr:polysaccharide pyruvyl transferase family protein [Candidatus Zophobacter franzmannii]
MKKQKQILITEADVVGNKGAVAMVNCIVRDLRRANPDLKVYVTSKYCPAGIHTLSNGEQVEILTDHLHEFDTALIKTWIRFLCSFLGFGKFLFRKDKVLKVYANCDLVLSTSGISFIDNFGIVKLYHYSKFLQIPILNNIPTIKFTQSLGPFKSKYNKMIAKLLLPHLKLIMARGRHTVNNLKELGITENVVSYPDIAVTLESYQTERVNNILKEFEGKEIIGVSPNEVCYRLDEKKIYLPSIFSLVDHILETHPNSIILLIPHTIAERDKGHNDFWLCERIYEYVNDPKHVSILDTLEMMPEEAKYIIGKCDYFIGSRFHSLIASTSMNTPTLAIGWHWKYEEMMEWMGIEGNLVQYWELDKVDLIKKFDNFCMGIATTDFEMDSLAAKASEATMIISEVLNES